MLTELVHGRCWRNEWMLLLPCISYVFDMSAGICRARCQALGEQELYLLIILFLTSTPQTCFRGVSQEEFFEWMDEKSSWIWNRQSSKCRQLSNCSAFVLLLLFFVLFLLFFVLLSYNVVFISSAQQSDWGIRSLLFLTDVQVPFELSPSGCNVKFSVTFKLYKPLSDVPCLHYALSLFPYLLFLYQTR